MNKYYFTFGMGQKYQGRYFVIKAKDRHEAETTMSRLFYVNWSFGYSEHQWNNDNAKLEHIIPLEKEITLEEIIEDIKLHQSDYALWDKERNMWWQKNRRGHSPSFLVAGYYDKDTAEEAVKSDYDKKTEAYLIKDIMERELEKYV